MSSDGRVERHASSPPAASSSRGDGVHRDRPDAARGRAARRCSRCRRAIRDPGETPADAALREVREEAGVEAELRREARRRALLVPARRRADRQDGRVLPVRLRRPASPTTTTTRSRRRAGCRWRRPPRALTYKGEREMAERALSRVRARPVGCRRRAGPELLLDDLRRPAQAGPQDGHDPARRQVAQVPQEPGGAGDDRLPALAAREDLRGRHRPGRGQARQATSRRATSSTTTPSSAATRR